MSHLAQVGNPSSEKGLLAAASEGFAALEPAHPSDAEIFVSAAPLTGDREKRERRRLEELFSPSGVRLFGVAFGERNFMFNGQPVFGIPLDLTQVDEHSEPFTSSEVLAYETGGMLLPFLATLTSSKPLARRPEAEALASFISNFYVLDLDVSQPSKQTQQLQIGLKNKNLAGRILIWHPTHLFPCPQPSAR